MATPSIRCRTCKQLKSCEGELRKAQVVLQEQSNELVRLREQVHDQDDRRQGSNTSLQSAMKTIADLSSQLSAKSAEVALLKRGAD